MQVFPTKPMPVCVHLPDGTTQEAELSSLTSSNGFVAIVFTASWSAPSAKFSIPSVAKAVGGGATAVCQVDVDDDDDDLAGKYDVSAELPYCVLLHDGLQVLDFCGDQEGLTADALAEGIVTAGEASDTRAMRTALRCTTLSLVACSVYTKRH